MKCMSLRKLRAEKKSLGITGWNNRHRTALYCLFRFWHTRSWWRERKVLSCNLEILEKVNHSTIDASFNDTLQILWPQKIQYQNALLVSSDAAPYMVKCMKGLQTLYPKMIHVTCKHKAQSSWIFRSEYSLVNKLIATGKSIFVKASEKIEMFKPHAPVIPSPHSPVLTRWGTWIDAATYYSKNY